MRSFRGVVDSGRAHCLEAALSAAVILEQHGEDNLERYQSSPGTYRCFCRTCGTSMVCYYTTESPTFGDPAGKMYVPVAVLTDPLDRLPDSHVSFEEHVNWFELSDELPRYRAKSDEQIR